MRIWEAKLVYNLLSLGEEVTLDAPDRVASYLESAFSEDPTVEWFIAVLLDRKNRPLGRAIISKGTASSSLVHPREVFKPAILAGASSVVVSHNHPSGDPAPSRADIHVTRQLREAAPRGIGYYSFNEAGLL